MLTPALVSLVLTSVVATSVLSGIFGMAGGMILMGVFGLLLSVELAMVLHGTAQLAANGSRCVSLLKNVDWRACGFYLIGAISSAALFWSIRFVPSKPIVFLILGLMPFLTLIKSFPDLDIKRPRDGIIAGFVVTAAHLTAGVSGPLLDLFFLKSQGSRFEIIATKAFTQSSGHLLKLFYFGTIATTLPAPPWALVAVVICAVVGTLIGGAILRKLNDENFRTYSRRIVMLTGSIYLAKALWDLSS